MDNNKRVEGVKTLCKNIIPYFEKTFFNRYVEDYKNYLGYTGDRQQLIEDWQTNVFFPIIPAIVDTMFASMYDSKIKFNLTGKGIKGTDNLLNHAFDYEGTGREALMESIKECIITGKGYLKPVFTKYNDVRMVNNIDYGEIVKRPVLNYVSIFNVFYDYNTTLTQSPFTIERYIISRKQIIKAYGARIEAKTGKKGTELESYIDGILKSDKKERYSEYDVNRIKHIIAYEDLISKNNLTTVIPTAEARNMQDTTDGSIENKNSLFAIDFKKNSVYEVIEYNDDDGTVVLVDGIMLFQLKNENKGQNNQFTDISFNRIPGTSDSTGIGTNLSEVQLIINTIYNIYLDNLKIQIAPMFEQVGGLNQMLGKKNKIVYSPYKIIPTNTPGAIRKIDLGVGGFEPINAIQFIEAFGEKRSGVNEYIMGGQGKVERVAGGVDLLFNQYKSKLMPLTNSINKAMGFIAKNFLLMYATNYTKDELKELGLEDELDYKRFLNEKNVSFNLTSLALLSEEEGIKNITEAIQSIGPYLQGPSGLNINTEELVKGILKRDVDVDKILQKPAAPEAPLGDDVNNLNINL